MKPLTAVSRVSSIAGSAVGLGQNHKTHTRVSIINPNFSSDLASSESEDTDGSVVDEEDRELRASMKLAKANTAPLGDGISFIASSDGESDVDVHEVELSLTLTLTLTLTLPLTPMLTLTLPKGPTPQPEPEPEPQKVLGFATQGFSSSEAEVELRKKNMKFEADQRSRNVMMP